MNNGNTKTLVLGLGNPILSDDGVGCRVAAALNDRLHEPGIEVLEAAVAGLDVLDILTGYDKTIIIDAIQTRAGTPGQIYRLEADALADTRHAATPHDVNLATALELGRRLGLPLPRQIIIFAIEAGDVTSFGEECTPEVTRAVPACAALVMRELNRG